MDKIVQKFMEYARFDTQSDPDNTNCPSSKGQAVFAEYLVKELKSIGLKDVSVDKNGYVMATLPSNLAKEVSAIGFIAHMDTSPDISGLNVNPQIVKNFDGKDIILNKEKNIVLSPKDFPELQKYIGQDLITTDGNTLLGADDKAGICALVMAVEHLLTHPEIKHPAIKIAFTPDEEIGRGANLFDVEKFNAEFAYTIDGGELGMVNFETFNAAEAKININGRNVHPGTAKNKMKNSMLIAMELNAMLPSAERPAHTEGYEGFYHLNSLTGNVETTNMLYIIRDHDRELFEGRKKLFGEMVKFLNDKHGEGTVELTLKDQYCNMREKIEPVMHIVDTARQAMAELGIVAKTEPVRGGTDGARLSYMKLPCPNIFTGGHNFHGKYEYLPVDSLKKLVDVILRIIALNVK